MPRTVADRICTRIREAAKFNLARCRCLAGIVFGVIDSRSVKLNDIAARLQGKANFTSKYRRLQSFFQRVEFNQDALAKLVVSALSLDEKLILTLDRTTWERRGNTVNLLVLAVCVGDVALPLFWHDLGHDGNSDTSLRMELVDRFVRAFGADRIRALLGDREFVGGDWFRWLQAKGIPLVMRVRDNFKVPVASGTRRTEVRNCFRGLRVEEPRRLGERETCGAKVGLCGMRLRDGDILILAWHGLGDDDDAIELYRQRWRIETLFQKLKGHGFHLEESRLRGDHKAETLLGVLALAAAWCYALGEWHAREVAPIPLKSHGRKAEATFRRGLDVLRQVFAKCAAQLNRVAQKAYSIIDFKARLANRLSLATINRC